MMKFKKVFKFGGSSLADASCFRQVTRIIETQTDTLGIVVSATQGTTDSLLEACQQAASKAAKYKEMISSLTDRHKKLVTDLLEKPHDPLQTLERDKQEILEILRASELSRTISLESKDLVVSYGERWSANILAQCLRENRLNAGFIDARDILVSEPGEIGPLILWEKSQQKFIKYFEKFNHDISVITGFVAQTEKGTTTTLGRNGSDFSASIFAKLGQAEEITIWTDVSGVYSADPRIVPEAQLIKQLSFQEAMELAYFGAKVIHPHTMGPAIISKIPLRIKNTFKPEEPGTLIDFESQADSGLVAKGISSINDVAIINLEGSGMIGVPGVAQRLFGALREVGISVIMISQASSEHSICFVIPEDQAEKAKQSVEQAFFAEIHQGKIQSVQIEGSCSVLAIVGENMVSTSGVSGRFFSALGNAGVNIRAIAQGSSERNISAVIDKSSAPRAIRAVHGAFYLSDFTLSVGLIGPGLVGTTLLKQIKEQKEVLLKRSNIDLRVRGICNSKEMLVGDDLTLESWANTEGERKPLDMDFFSKHINAEVFPHSLIIDCTASEKVPEYYAGWLKEGVHIVTPNKKANSSEISIYKLLKEECLRPSRHYFYEATVGAGLPIISTLQDLVSTGDEILKIEGILSGTLSYIFNNFNSEKKFSDVLKQAKSLGLTEPDPRDDLSGTDVARKIVILARESGFHLDLNQVEIESLTPPGLSPKLSVDEFLNQVHTGDEALADRMRLADKNDEVLRYIGTFERNGNASVKIQRIHNKHPFARITGTDNILALTTRRYMNQPLIIQGPGAGPDVTAAGVFSDILRLAANLGAPL